jgi:quercetin dioxygenase-like cupin family protein
MHINANFQQAVLIHADDLPWMPSPSPGIERRMFDRIGNEAARATSLVRYAPSSRFASHTHDGGEEYLVLDGVFQDELGNHPQGSYVRNPPNSRHTPHSEEGCVIFVKLRQFDLGDRHSVEIDLTRQPVIEDRYRAGVGVQLLHEDTREQVQIETWAPHSVLREQVPFATEWLVLKGGLELLTSHHSLQAGVSQSVLHKWSWLRLPAGSELHVRVQGIGATVWIKRHRRPLAMELSAFY